MRILLKRPHPSVPVTCSLATTLAFLARIWALHPKGFVFLAARTLGGRWIEKRFHVVFGWRAIERFFEDYPALTHDLYYCPNAFSQRKRLAKFALPTKFAWCDIDSADPGHFRPQPTTLIETSLGRYQGLWKFHIAASPARAEAISRHLTDTYHGDRGGWSITKMLRLPGTLNHKPAYGLPVVRIVYDKKLSIANWPVINARRAQRVINGRADPYKHDPDAVIEKYRAFLTPRSRWLMKHPTVMSRDRSRIIFMIIAALRQAGADPDEIASVLWRSPYFTSKHGPNLFRLTQEVLRILSKIGAQNE